MTASQVGHYLQSARKAAGLSQAELALRIGLGQSRLSKLEQDPASLTVDQLLRICGALRLDLSVAPKPDGPLATGSEW
nr:helix-turn-helix transcriptional regulator [Ramlibacter paludis]